jgi:membrane fusion protein (multidrug efflux system)
LTIFGVFALAGLSYGVYWFFWGQYPEKTDNAYVMADVSTVSPKAQGYVVKIFVRENERVKAGQPLVQLQDNDYRAAIAQVQAALVSAEQALVLQKSIIHEAEAKVSSAKAEQSRAAKDEVRYRNLVKQAYVSRQKLESAQAIANQADAALRQAEATLESEHSRVSVLESQRKEAVAKLAASQIDLDNTIIRAPIDGVVGNRTVQEGLLARPGMMLMSIVPLPNVYVVANFKETQLKRMRIGQPVTLKFDAYPDTELQGRVESFSPGTGSRWSLLPPENATGNFTKIVQRVPVRISVPPDNPLADVIRPGLSVVAIVDTKPSHSPTK